MASKLSSQEKWDRMEHYAYRTHNLCVKYEEIKTLVGGWHDWHPVILDKVAFRIYKSFLDSSKIFEEKNPKLETFYSVTFDDGKNKQYRIHIFNLERVENKRKSMWINAGIYLKLPTKLGYTRIFRMPCKCLF